MVGKFERLWLCHCFELSDIKKTVRTFRETENQCKELRLIVRKGDVGGRWGGFEGEAPRV